MIMLLGLFPTIRGKQAERRLLALLICREAISEACARRYRSTATKKYDEL